MNLAFLTEALKCVSREDAECEARLLLCHFGGFSFSDLLVKNPDFSSPELEEALRRRLANEPLAYILGQTEFYGEKYFVSPDCLIPRSDTEIIVEYAIKNLKEGAFFADFCTGSGCIAISVLAHRPDCKALACDISEKALQIARKNADLNSVSDRISFISHDILSDNILGDTFDAIISNPPYIQSEVIKKLSPEVKREPVIALDGGPDGMTFYRQIVKFYLHSLSENGFFLFETGYDQKSAIQEIAESNRLSCECLTDYGKNHRGAILKKQL